MRMQKRKIQFFRDLRQMVNFLDRVSLEQNKLILIASSDDCGGPTTRTFFSPDQIIAFYSPYVALEVFEVE